MKCWLPSCTFLIDEESVYYDDVLVLIYDRGRQIGKLMKSLETKDYQDVTLLH